MGATELKVFLRKRDGITSIGEFVGFNEETISCSWMSKTESKLKELESNTDSEQNTTGGDIYALKS